MKIHSTASIHQFNSCVVALACLVTIASAVGAAGAGTSVPDSLKGTPLERNSTNGWFVEWGGGAFPAIDPYFGAITHGPLASRYLPLGYNGAHGVMVGSGYAFRRVEIVAMYTHADIGVHTLTPGAVVSPAPIPIGHFHLQLLRFGVLRTICEWRSWGSVRRLSASIGPAVGSMVASQGAVGDEGRTQFLVERLSTRRQTVFGLEFRASAYIGRHLSVAVDGNWMTSADRLIADLPAPNSYFEQSSYSVEPAFGFTALRYRF